MEIVGSPFPIPILNGTCFYPTVPAQVHVRGKNAPVPCGLKGVDGRSKWRSGTR